MSGIGQCVLGVLLVVLLEKLLSLPLQILVKLHQEAILQMALQNVLGRGVALLSSTHLCVVTVLHRPNVLVVMVVEIFMEEILMGIQATETNMIGHLIGDIGAHLEAGALQDIEGGAGVFHTVQEVIVVVTKTVARVGVQRGVLVLWKSDLK